MSSAIRSLTRGQGAGEYGGTKRACQADRWTVGEQPAVWLKSQMSYAAGRFLDPCRHLHSSLALDGAADPKKKGGEEGMRVVLDPLISVLLMAIDIYIWMIIASAILSWLVAFNVLNRQNQFVNSIGVFLWRITEPALKPIRRIIPAFGGIDITPVILILVLIFLQRLLINVLVAL